MRNTLQAVFDTARAMLQGGDTSPSQGLPNVVMQQFFNVAYPEMWQIMAQVQTPRVKREFYHVVPAYTSYLDPVAIGVTDFGEPEQMWERGSLTSVAVTSTSTASPIVVTTGAPHGLSSNADAIVAEVVGTTAPWGRWYVTVTGASTLTLNGSVTDGNTGTGGVLVTSAEHFDRNPLRALGRETDRAPSPRLFDYVWQNSAFLFRGATQDSQIRCTYWASATPPTNSSVTIGVDDCMAFLATRVASLAATARGLYNMADRLETRALGPNRQADGSGGLLRGFLNIQVQGLQREQFRKPPFRSGGGTGFDYIYGSASGLK